MMMMTWCVVLLKRHSSIVRHTFITQGGEGRGEKIRRGKLRKAKAEALKRGLVARSCARSGRKDVVGEVSLPPPLPTEASK